MSVYDQVWSGEWSRVTGPWDLACCDCGRVHIFRVKRRKGKTYVQFVVDNRKTSAYRREHHRKRSRGKQ